MPIDVATLDTHRTALVGHCYRMLGSAADAEDAVQETMLRAWQRQDQYDPARGSERNWLYGIATHASIDLARRAERRALPTDFAAPEDTDDLGRPLPESQWLTPIPTGRALPTENDPAEVAILRDSLRLAFVNALQRLPARQRAVLILREVLRWSAAEVAELLGLSAPAVNSMLQRARTTLAAEGPTSDADHGPDVEQLLDRYVDAFSRHDIETLVRLLHEDATSSMPPFPWWLRGRDRVVAKLDDTDFCRGSVFVPIAANGTRAYAQYLPADRFPGGDPGELQAWAILCLSTSGGAISEEISFLQPEPLFELFELPLVRPMNSVPALRTAP